MSYCTPQDLIDAFGEVEIIELTDRATPRTNAVDMAVAQGACDRATAEVNAALAGRYALPLPTVPALLKYIGKDLARYHLWDSQPPDLVAKRYEAATAQLRELARGVLSLGADVDGATVATPPRDLAEIIPGEKVWGRGNW